MDAKCPGIIKFCAVRFTLLDDDGSAAAGPDNSYVSDKSVTLAINSDIEQGQRRTIRSGCDCVVVTSRSPDTLLGYTFELVQGVWEPALQAMLLGADPLNSTDGSAVIGLNVSGDTLGCGTSVRKVAMEAWANAWDLSGPDPDLAYVKYVWPSTKWQRGSETLGADATTPNLSGFSERNQNWGSGPYTDDPTDGTTPVDVDFFAQYMVNSIPAASCDYQTIA